MIKLGINWMFLELFSVFRLNFKCNYIHNTMLQLILIYHDLHTEISGQNGKEL
jgi:hypothetical protein